MYHIDEIIALIYITYLILLTFQTHFKDIGLQVHILETICQLYKTSTYDTQNQMLIKGRPKHVYALPTQIAPTASSSLINTEMVNKT